MSDSGQITELLTAWNEGDKEALDLLIPLVEAELRRIAGNFMRRENPHHSLQTTGLINETYLKLIDQREAKWQNRAHFFALAAQIMRRILINYARDRQAGKRGGGADHVNLEDTAILSPEKSEELLALNEALDKLSKIDPVKSRIVEMRYFGGMTIEETGQILGMAPTTVSLHWRLARAWLGREIRGENYKFK